MLGNDILLTQALLFPPVLHPVRALAGTGFPFSKPLLGAEVYLIPYPYPVTLRIALDKEKEEKHPVHSWRMLRMCWA